MPFWYNIEIFFIISTNLFEVVRLKKDLISLFPSNSVLVGRVESWPIKKQLFCLYQIVRSCSKAGSANRIASFELLGLNKI